MRKWILILIALVILVLTAAFYPGYVQKPEKDGRGELSLWIDPVYAAPEYHSPLDWWQSNHWEIVNRGDIVQRDCLHCHEPERSCNNCHGYVGANEIEE